MPASLIDLTTPQSVVNELCSDDATVRAEFVNQLAKEIEELAEPLAECFRLTQLLNEAAGGFDTKRAALVAVLAYGVVDDLLISVKLLLSGKGIAAGHLMRHVIEGIAVSLLCSTNESLVLKKSDKPDDDLVTGCYWRLLWDQDGLAHGHLALKQLKWNAETLEVRRDSVAKLISGQRSFNAYSHAGITAVVFRVSLGKDRAIFAGGHFDEKKLEFYRKRIGESIGLCRTVPSLLRHLLTKLAPSADEAKESLPATPAPADQPGTGPTPAAA